MRISVAVCTYNGAEYIKEQLESIINQTRKVDEVVLCDDNSKDNTTELAEEILSKAGIKHKVIKNETNKGVVANFTNAFLTCEGDVIFSSDQDDVWKPEKVEKIMQVFESHEDCMMVFTDADVTNQVLEHKSDLWDSLGFDINKQKAFEENPYSVLFTKNVVTGATMAVRKELVTQGVPMPDKSLCLHDFWLVLIAPLFGKVYLLPDKLIYYRQHGNNVVGVTKMSIGGRIKRWIKRLGAEVDLNSRRQLLAEYILKQYKNKENTAAYKDVSSWNDFCISRSKLYSMNSFKAVLKILEFKRKGLYKKYYDMFMPALKDVFVCLFKLDNRR